MQKTETTFKEQLAGEWFLKGFLAGVVCSAFIILIIGLARS